MLSYNFTWILSITHLNIDPFPFMSHLRIEMGEAEYRGKSLPHLCYAGGAVVISSSYDIIYHTTLPGTASLMPNRALSLAFLYPRSCHSAW